jgi:hypothetical protein
MKYTPEKNLLTPALDEFEGWGLVELTLNKVKY